MLIESKTLGIDEKLTFIFSKKIFINLYDKKNLLQEKIKFYEEKLNKIEDENNKYFDDPTVSYLLTKVFTPSKTALNGLTFVTKDEENNLCKKDQPEEILNVFRIIYTIINENYTHLEPNKIIDNLIHTILPKIQVENLSNFYFKNRKPFCSLYFKIDRV